MLIEMDGRHLQLPSVLKQCPTCNGLNPNCRECDGEGIVEVLDEEKASDGDRYAYDQWISLQGMLLWLADEECRRQET